MSRAKPKPGELWEHYQGSQYRIIGIGFWEPTIQEAVIYQSTRNGRFWVRPLDVFMESAGVNPRFSKVDE